jgi:hypothetical protein
MTKSTINMNMNKRLDTAIIMILLLILIGIGVSGCAVPKKSQDNPNGGIYDGSIVVILGCMFSPNDCEKYKKDTEQKQQQDEITKEFEEIDNQKQSEGK